MKPRRILIFSFAYYPRFVGGAEVAVKEITDRISPSEIEFDMVTIGDGRGVREEKIGNVTVHRVFKGMSFLPKLFFPFAAYFKSKKLHKKDRYDATWSIMANRAGFAALFFKWMHPEVPFILTLQEGDPLDYPTKRGWMVAPIFKYIFRKADRITALSRFLADWAKQMGAICPVTIVPNAVDYGFFSKPVPVAEVSALKEKLGKKPGDVFLITTSRLVVKNAVGDIIEALQYLPSNVKLLILGQGPEEEDLRVKATDPKFGDRVTFVGFVDHLGMPPYLAVSDIFTRPSLSEGFGASFVEAMAAGIPVITTPVGGIPDFLIDGETGLFCDVGNPRSIAQKVEKLLKDPESRTYIVSTAKKMVETKYQWGTVVEQMKKVLKS